MYEGTILHRDYCNLLEEKLQAFKNFLAATLSLKEVSASPDDIETVEMLLGKRRQYIDMIDHIDRQINRLTETLPHHPSPVPDESKGRITALIRAIADIATQAAHLNQEIEPAVKLFLDTLRDGMQQVTHARHGIQGYARSRPSIGAPRFLNVTS